MTQFMLSQFDLTAHMYGYVSSYNCKTNPRATRAGTVQIKPLTKEDIKNKYMIHLIINPNTHRYIYTSKMNAQPHKAVCLLWK